MHRKQVVVVAFCLSLGGVARAGDGEPAAGSHREHIERYEGTKTCLACHEAEAKALHGTIHYQWQATAPQLASSGSRKLGKLGMVNDFCTSVSVNWIGRLKNAEGKVIARGCSACHVGLGAKPTAEATQAQLENIDCLVCHARDYRREVAGEDGALHFEPALAPAALLTAARDPQRPDSATCLRCHAGSGGGTNFKRGDLETAALKSRDFDAHLGSSLTCLECHGAAGHRIAGAGSQLAGRDEALERGCSGCHDGATAHRDPKLARHLARVACTTCHIPSFAKDRPTDMHRDFSRSEAVAGAGKFEPAIEFRKDVKPVYAWWNGNAKVALPDEAVRVESGAVRIWAPEGSRADPHAKIHPFKLHTARLPVDSETRRLVPVKVGIIFKTGDTAAAIRAGAKAAGMSPKGIAWVSTERYMAISHEVVPAARAVPCADCHGGGRIDWKALGYTGDPAR